MKLLKRHKSCSSNIMETRISYDPICDLSHNSFIIKFYSYLIIYYVSLSSSNFYFLFHHLAYYVTENARIVDKFNVINYSPMS